MANAPARKKVEATPDEEAAPAALRASRGMLMAAVALSMVSLGGGFFLARLALEADAKEFEPDYVAAAVDETEPADTDPATPPETSEAGEEGSVEDGFLEFEDIVTDIVVTGSDGQGSRSFLKLSVILVYRPEPGARELVEARQPFMRDLFTTFARSLTEAEVRGAAGLMVIKSELLKRARAATGNSLPQDVLIRDIIIQ